MKFIYSFILPILALFLLSCSDNKSEGPDVSVSAPTEVTFTRTGDLGVSIHWKDNSDNETGFKIWIRNASDSQDRKNIATIDANNTSYDITSGLTEGSLYYFGVQAINGNSESVITYSPLCKLSPISNSNIKITETKSTNSCISIAYSMSDIKETSGLKQGICWSKDNEPTTKDNVIYGPAVNADGKTILQTIPCTLIEYGVTYKVRAFVESPTSTSYSATQSLSLGACPEMYRLTWNKLNITSLPSSVEVYETTSTLNGGNFHAWYAIADISKGDVELRACVPSKATTIDDQAAAYGESCLVMINGGYFYNGNHTGVSVLNSVTSGSISAVRGSLKTADSEYNVMYNITRGAFGTDASGKPSVYWAGTDASGVTRYYDRPLTSIKGETKYNAPSIESPTSPISWSPKYALSAGPVLLKNGKCPFDFTTTSNGDDFYLTNYEIIPYDIFGPTVSPDRTAMGITSDGKIIMFICDGRITQSKGATLTELAQIMRGLGCVDAVNFDGGGSTGMTVGGKHLNDVTGGNRAVVSTFGFFKK